MPGDPIENEILHRLKVYTGTLRYVAVMVTLTALMFMMETLF